MTEEERIFSGILFCPSNPELKKLKLCAHNLSSLYNRTLEDEIEKREHLLVRILGHKGDNCFIQGPVFFHYGVHTEIGDNFFGNFNLTIQDDAKVIIGNNANFGPNVTIVTPIHPLVASERRQLLDQNGVPKYLCYANPVFIGDDVWLSANVTVCGGVTIGDRCVIAAGSVVNKDIPNDSFAAGVPCKVIRKITYEDSLRFQPEILADCHVIDYP